MAYSVICLRENANGEKVAIPIMKDDAEGEPGDSMAQFDTYEEAEVFCAFHILCSKSMNIIIDLDDPELSQTI